MKKRWLIRSLALTLLTLCVAAWAASYWRTVYGGLHVQTFNWDFSARVEDGSLWGTFSHRNDLPADFPAWRGGIAYVDPSDRLAWVITQYRIVGFTFQHDAIDNHLYAGIPFWFTTLLCALLLWLVWRKTKSNMPNHAFPVVVPA